jgi:hypothetical protein
MTITLAPQEVFKDLKSVFVTLLHDASVAPAARSAVAYAYSTICFLSVDEGEVENVMAGLEKIFLSNSSAHQVPITAKQFCEKFRLCSNGLTNIQKL